MTLKKSERFLTEYKTLMLDLCHELNYIITTVVDGSSFKKIFKTILERKMTEEDITFTRVLQ